MKARTPWWAALVLTLPSDHPRLAIGELGFGQFLEADGWRKSPARQLRHAVPVKEWLTPVIEDIRNQSSVDGPSL